MNPKSTFKVVLLISVVLAFIVLIGANVYYASLPERIERQQTFLLGRDNLTPGSQAALRVVVRDDRSGEPVKNASIRISLSPGLAGNAIPLYSGVTDQAGTAEVSFSVPADLPDGQHLVVETASPLGANRLERPVNLVRDYKVLLATDKPVYQPGQVMHIRALALGAFDLMPAASQSLQMVIADGKGNKVFRQAIETDDFGVAFADFQLANEVNTGDYKVSAILGEASTEKTVNVSHYALPKFDMRLSTERRFYQPGQRVNGSLQADYFFGKPVSGGRVVIEGYTFDVGRNVVMQLEGETGPEGEFAFELDLPAYIAGSDLEGGLGVFYLQATLTDQAQHSETATLSVPVAQQSILIEAIPEGGQFYPGLETIFYVMTSYPDGSPAVTNLRLTWGESGAQQTASTGDYGLAEFRHIAQSPWQQVTIEARDAQGNLARQELTFEGRSNPETVLLRPDRPVYRVGETMNLEVLSSDGGGVVYLDIVREGQLVSTRSLAIENGRGLAAIDLSPDLFGTLELHAYKLRTDGIIVRDTRMVVVDQAEDLSVQLNAGAESYRPGDQASLDIQVNDASGAGVASALGLAVVDESVFALAEQDPGFAKLYFLLESELLQPRYDLHGYGLSNLLREPVPQSKPLERAANNAAQASLAAAVQGAPGVNLLANSREEAVQTALLRQQRFFAGMSRGLFALFLVLPGVVVVLALLQVARSGRAWDRLSIALWTIVLPLILLLVWPLGENSAWAQTPLDRLSLLVNWLSWQGPLALSILALVGLMGLIYLAGYAWVKRDRLLRWSLGLALAALVVLVWLFITVSKGQIWAGDKNALAGLLAYALLPLAFLLWFGHYAAARRWSVALASLCAAAFLLIGFIPVLASGSALTPLAAGAARFKAGGGPVMVDQLAMVEAPAAMEMLAPMPTATPMIEMVQAGDAPREEGQASPAPRLRQYFPETMLWLPAERTDANGNLHLEFPMADSITTWRLTALASSQDGRLGSATAGLRAFQDFFIDLDLPAALTVGDEVSIPVGVFNYLAEEQTVRLELEQGGWFELVSDPVQELRIAANDIDVVYFRIRAREFGRKPFKVTAIGSKMSDAIQKEVQVYPDGKPFNQAVSGRLLPDEPVQITSSLPEDTIPGTQSILVKIYPGVVSQVVEGLDSLLRMPSGCFEQTSSTTYPNLLVLDYLRTTQQAAPEVEMKAEEYINLGYQRLLTFEVPGGGFSLFWETPADRMLSAYGLQEFADMRRVHAVDEDLLQRTAEWLLGQQAADGSWENDRGLVHETTWSQLGNDRLPVTAYIVWSLAEAGYGGDGRTQNGVAYLREHQAQAEDPYVLALMSNALVASDLAASGELQPGTLVALERLAGMAERDEGTAYWSSRVATFMGSEGKAGSIETTALAALALLRAEVHPGLSNAAIGYLIQAKDSFGTWQSTQATVLTLKAMMATLQSGAEQVQAHVEVRLNGSQLKQVEISPENFDVVHLLSFEDLLPAGDNRIDIAVSGEGSLMYQVVTGFTLPWERLGLYPQLEQAEAAMAIEVQYDRTELAVNDTVQVQVSARLTPPGSRAESAIIDLGIPPGFSVEVEDLAALVQSHNMELETRRGASIQRFELTGRQIILYVTNLSSEETLIFSYRLRAKYPLVAQAPASSAYDYYNPDVTGEVSPQLLVVTP